jgi:rRNA-processing protein FCF1
MCNGANLAFKKAIYELVDGYQFIIHTCLLEKIYSFWNLSRKVDSTRIQYGLIQRVNCENIHSCNNLNDLLNQRVRWASKTKENPNLLNSFFAFIVLVG